MAQMPLHALLESWEEEKQSSYLYRAMAETEKDPRKRALFAKLAEMAEAQAAIWARHIEEAGGKVPAYAPSLRARLVAKLLPIFGVRRMRPVLVAMKVRGMSAYAPLVHPMPTSVEQVGRRHKGMGEGGNLRAAVFGVNDGLVSNTSLILGVAGAEQSPEVVLLSGIAGWLAGAFSMAAGEYVSMRSQRELFEFQIALEREELTLYPEEEAEELALIYGARGLPMEEARRMARRLIRDPEKALDALAREELGLDPEDLGSPWGAAVSSFLSFSLGALIPLLPFLLGASDAVSLAIVLAGIALFGVGAAISLFTGKGALASGLRMVVVGGGAGLVTFLVGRLLGVTLG